MSNPKIKKVLSNSNIKKVLGKVVDDLSMQLREREKNQDKVLPLSREVVRYCANAIRHLHTGDKAECERVIKELTVKVRELQEVGKAFPNIIDQPLQEFAEIKIFHSLLFHKPMPSPEDLQIPVKPYLGGVADCVGELRRALQLALKDGDHKEAEYYFQCMNEMYDELMVLKFSASLVGSLKHKQDMVRGQLEHSRSEMLRCAK